MIHSLYRLTVSRVLFSRRKTYFVWVTAPALLSRQLSALIKCSPGDNDRRDCDKLWLPEDANVKGYLEIIDIPCFVQLQNSRFKTYFRSCDFALVHAAPLVTSPRRPIYSPYLGLSLPSYSLFHCRFLLREGTMRHRRPFSGLLTIEFIRRLGLPNGIKLSLCFGKVFLSSLFLFILFLLPFRFSI